MAYGETLKDIIDSDPRTKSGQLQTPPQQDRSAWQFYSPVFDRAARNLDDWMKPGVKLTPILQARKNWGYGAFGFEAICKLVLPTYWDEDFRIGEGGFFGSGLGFGGRRFLATERLIDPDHAPKDPRLTKDGKYRKSTNTVVFDSPDLPPFLPATTIIESLEPAGLTSRYRVEHVSLQPLPLYLPNDHHTQVDESPSHLLATVEVRDVVDLLDSPNLSTSRAKLLERQERIDAELAELHVQIAELNQERERLSDENILRIQERNKKLKAAAEALPKLF